MAAEVENAELKEGPYNRLMGYTEHNWCRAVSSGTGVTVVGLLFSQSLDLRQVQHALDNVLRCHPRLRSQMVWVNGRPAFVVDPNSSSSSSTQVQVLNGEDEFDSWLGYVEKEMNINMWAEEEFQQPLPLLVARLYHLLSSRKHVLIIRVHTAACDRVSAATLVAEFLRHLHDCKNPKNTGKKEEKEEDDDDAVQLVAVEDAIPKGQANKPFWAHGVDLVGYSVGSLRHALLPFDDPHSLRRTNLITAQLTQDLTQQLLKTCSTKNTNLFGALTAAGLKATTIFKQLGNQSEHYAIISLIDCRHHIPNLAANTVGFYHSAVLNTHRVSESGTEMWELAKRCSTALETSVRNRKHFTDMGDINYLMVQALTHPNITSMSTLRTSLMVVFEDAIIEDDVDVVREELGLEDYTGCSSVHGVGPCFAIFHSLRNGALHLNIVYATPLYSRDTMNKLVHILVDLLTHSIVL